MKKLYNAFGIIFLFLAFVVMDANAQIRYVDVAPGPATLTDTINGDTTELGERIDPLNTVYRLQRGTEAIYLLDGSISNDGYPLTIEAAEGDGPRPFLQPMVVDNESSRPFRPRGDITLRGLHVTNLDNGGGYNTRMLRCSADDIHVTLDDCWFDQDGQSFIRVDNPGMHFIITNCVISNIGRPLDPNNGRGIDDRGNDIDTIIIENCTFFNITSRIIRDDGGIIKYAKINNNTMVNVAQMGITFGPIDTLIVTNNIAVNAGFLPKDDDDGWEVFSADSANGVAPYVEFTNNTAYVDTSRIVAWLNDTTTVTPIFNETLALAVAAAGNEDDNENWNIVFTDGPPFNDSLVIYENDPAFADLEAPDWVVPDVPGPPDGNGAYHLDVYYDFGYAHGQAATGATDGGQLGDRNWEASWGTGIQPVLQEGVTLSLYPMPVADRATISFKLETEATVQMELYSLTGQHVAEVINTRYPAGTHHYNWDTGMLETGMYLLRMKAGNASSTIKMIVR
jgi:hypothetical protein